MYAVIAHSGKQYNVKPGLRFNVEKVTEAVGEVVKLEQVLLFDDGQAVLIHGHPGSGSKLFRIDSFVHCHLEDRAV